MEYGQMCRKSIPEGLRNFFATAGASRKTYNPTVCVLVVLLCFSIAHTEAGPYSPRFWIRVSKCAGLIKFKCAYMSNYCNPRLLKRSITEEENPSSDLLHVIKKRSSRRSFHVSCRACSRFCW